MSRSVSVVAALVLVVGLCPPSARAQTPFGGDDTGFIPPPKSPTAKCESGAAKAADKLIACILKCHASRASLKLADDTAEDSCEKTLALKSCTAKFAASIAKLSGCPACINGTTMANLAGLIESTLDAQNSTVYCDTSSGTPFGGDDTGDIPTPKSTSAKCEAGAAKAEGKLIACIDKCHASRAAGKLADDTAEDSCEKTLAGKSCVAKFTLAISKLAGCPSCINGTTMANLAGLTESLLDGNNSTVYCSNGSTGPTLLDFTVGIGGATCGSATNSSNTVLATLHCGGLNIGGGMSTVAEGPTPDGTTNRFTLNCGVSPCTVGHFDTAPAANSADPDCSNTGCNFGAPLEIPNATSPALSSCVANVYAAPASGTLSLSDGSSSQTTSLTSSTFITGNVGQPCPRCRSGGGTGSILHGTPSSPATGNCDRTAGHPACTTTNSIGLTRDCPAAGIAVGPIGVDLSPLNTGVSNKSDPAGNFCPNQGTGTPGTSGCFGHGGTGATLCVDITENGSAAGPLTTGIPAPATLASVFCIPATGGIVDSAADLPGPGATALVGTLNAHN